jgi:hypothetical protein
MAMLTDPNRSAAEAFPEIARTCGLEVDTEAIETIMPGGLQAKGRIWRLRRSDSVDGISGADQSE